MKVYILFSYDDLDDYLEDPVILGIFKNREKAEEDKKKLEELDKIDKTIIFDKPVKIWYTIEEHDIIE